jgi:hypothetical protein
MKRVPDALSLVGHHGCKMDEDAATELAAVPLAWSCALAHSDKRKDGASRPHWI